MNQIQDFDLIALLLQDIAGSTQYLTLGVQNNEAAVRVQHIGNDIETGLAGTGTADHEDIEIAPMSPAPEADPHILRQDLIEERVLILFGGIFPVDDHYRPPLGRAVLFPAAVVAVIRKINADADHIDHGQDQNGARGILTPSDGKWICTGGICVGDQLGKSAVHIRGNQQAQPEHRDQPKGIAPEPFPGELILVHPDSESPVWVGYSQSSWSA